MPFIITGKSVAARESNESLDTIFKGHILRPIIVKILIE